METNELLTFADRPIENEQVIASTNQIDRREWWLWSSAISVMLLLAVGIASFALPALLLGFGFDSFHALLLDHAVRGLFGLVIVFNTYVVYEQIQINRIRQEFVDNLYKMALIDPVTNMFNRRFILTRLAEEIARCQRHGNPLTVLALDLDHFKEINDQYGHAVGDCVLRRFGEQLKRATRGSDVAARYGGDEFLAILPDCSIKQIGFVLERLDGLQLKTPEFRINILYSAGWTDYIPGEPLIDLLKRADDMLYAKKRNPKGFFGSSIGEE